MCWSRSRGLQFAFASHPPNQDYLVPYRTTFLLYITVRIAVTWTAFTMGTMICKVFSDDPNRQRLKDASVYSASTGLCVQHRAQAIRGAWHSTSASISYV